MIDTDATISGMPNEAMKLQAADAVAVADAADNGAPKQRRRGPQLMAGAFGRCLRMGPSITGRE